MMGRFREADRDPMNLSRIEESSCLVDVKQGDDVCQKDVQIRRRSGAKTVGAEVDEGARV